MFRSNYCETPGTCSANQAPQALEQLTGVPIWDFRVPFSLSQTAVPGDRISSRLSGGTPPGVQGFRQKPPEHNAAVVTAEYGRPALRRAAVLRIEQQLFQRAQKPAWGGFFDPHPESRAVLFEDRGRELLVRVLRYPRTGVPAAIAGYTPVLPPWDTTTLHSAAVSVSGSRSATYIPPVRPACPCRRSPAPRRRKASTGR